MKIKAAVLVLPLFIYLSQEIYGQNAPRIEELSDKILISSGLEYLEFINDSILFSSINKYDDSTKFEVLNSTLIIIEDYTWYGPNNTSGNKIVETKYPVLKQTPDTLILENTYTGKQKPNDWEDILVFVNLNIIKERINNFRYLELVYLNPFGGSKTIEIDSLGNILLLKDPEIIDSSGRNLSRITGNLTNKEFRNYKELLECSLVTRLAKKRSCPIDGSRKNFTIRFDDKEIISKGCDLSWIQYKLVNYLLEIEKNRGFVNQKKG